MRWSYYTAPTKNGNDVSNFEPSAFSAGSEPAICASPSGAALGSLPACAVSSYGFTSTTWQYLKRRQLAIGEGQPHRSECGQQWHGYGRQWGTERFHHAAQGSVRASPRLCLSLDQRRQNIDSRRRRLRLHPGGPAADLNLLSNIPFVQTPVYFNTEFTNPAGVSGSGSVPDPPGLLAVNSTNNSYRPATIRDYSLTIERQVAPGGVVAIGYAGMTTQHIFTTGWDSTSH